MTVIYNPEHVNEFILNSKLHEYTKARSVRLLYCALILAIIQVLYPLILLISNQSFIIPSFLFFLISLAGTLVTVHFSKKSIHPKPEETPTSKYLAYLEKRHNPAEEDIKIVFPSPSEFSGTCSVFLTGEKEEVALGEMTVKIDLNCHDTVVDLDQKTVFLPPTDEPDYITHKLMKESFS